MCASTNLAALAFPHCFTAHGLFGYPVLEDYDVNDALEKTQCNPTQERLELLNATKVIIWDEFFMNHRDLFDAALELLQENTKLLFVVTGDGRQCPVVVPFANAAETILASIISSCHWPLFTVRSLSSY
jgi:hypothetical protein